MQTSFWDTPQCSPSSGTGTPRQPSNNGQMTDGSRSCTCITKTSSCLIHPNTKDEWIACMQDSLAKIFQSPVLEKALQENAADSGKKLNGALAIWESENSSWKTAQQSLVEDSMLYSETLPPWGLMQDGVCYQLLQSVPRTYELDGGALQGIPTPSAQEAGLINLENIAGEIKRNSRIYSKTTGKHMQVTLNRYVHLWPTPTAAAHKGSSPGSLIRKCGRSREFDRLDHAVMTTDGGQLNPEWVEWLMGWPIGATELNV